MKKRAQKQEKRQNFKYQFEVVRPEVFQSVFKMDTDQGA